MADIKISLAAARVNAKLTQSEVAQKLKVSNKTVCSWETGKRIPDYATLFTLSSLYGIPMDCIFLPNEST